MAQIVDFDPGTTTSAVACTHGGRRIRIAPEAGLMEPHAINRGMEVGSEGA